MIRPLYFRNLHIVKLSQTQLYSSVDSEDLVHSSVESVDSVGSVDSLGSVDSVHSVDWADSVDAVDSVDSVFGSAKYIDFMLENKHLKGVA